MINKFIFIVAIIFVINCQSQISFPDNNFKAKLLSANLTNGNACIGPDMNNCITGVIDSNGNGEIEISEAQAVAILFVTAGNITNLSGIEYFTNLEKLEFSFNNLIYVDINMLTSLKQLGCRNNNLQTLTISNLTNLKILDVANNQLSSLNINNQSQLEMLFALNNQLTSLDFTNNSALQRAYVGNNLFTSLNFGNNPNFFDLGCKNNPNLTTINIKNGATQLFPPNTLYNECWSNCPNLSYVCADANEISSLQSFLSTCGNSASITVDSLCPLGNEEFSLNSVVLYPNPVADILHIDLTNEATRFEQITIDDSVGKTIVTKKITPFTTNEIEIISLQSGFYFVILNNNEVSKKMKLIKK
ncbi:T9SS type A sorting domain-containing protein [Flavobacterium sp.]|uniref:T9SS type A sorting domain-containing protein n=1 Tax=Flavobacterium sp. TaxID=239 RepID=UPI002607CA48|nr:T9SS type A sorting domain-containing protein [Flavobacterium sp.]